MVDVPRRRVLAGLALTGLAGLAVGCTDDAGGPAPAPTSTVPPPPDPLLAELVDERTLLGTYDATLLRHPSLRPRLAGPRADHAAHVAALERLLETAPTPAASPGVGVPGTPAAALITLRAAERAASAARGAAALTASPDRAGLLASIAASEATHGVVLT